MNARDSALLVGLVALLTFWPARATEPAKGEATILFITDAHEIAPVVDALGDRGGTARLKTVIDGLKRKDPTALLVFGGDLAGGTLFGGVFKGEPMVDALGRAGVGLASFGQHDFDFGSAHTRSLVSRSGFPWITSNLVTSDGRPFAGLPTRLLRTVGTLRVGFLGLTSGMETTTPEPAALKVVQRDLVETARAEAAALKREGAEAIVALTQAPASVNERLLREVPLIDAILTEEEAEERSVVQFVGARPIAAPCGNLGSVVELRLRRESRRIAMSVLAHPVDATVPPDAALAANERTFMNLLADRLRAPVGTLPEALPTEGSRVRETALGSLVADALREAVGAQVALVPGSSLRADLPAGALTRREVLSVLPFGNTVTLLELPGTAIRAALEKGLAGLSGGSASLLQVSGLAYSADPAAPASRRLRDVTVGTEPLRDDAIYRVAVTSYLASGGEGFAQLATARRVELPAGEPVDADALAAHLASRLLRTPGAEPPSKAARITLRSDSDRR